MDSVASGAAPVDLTGPAVPAEPEAASVIDTVTTVMPVASRDDIGRFKEEFGRVHTAFGERDTQISELQQAVIELANTVEGPLVQAGLANAQEVSALQERMAAMETRLAEQERTLRHTLTMLIEWIETDDIQRAA
jgi:hypothetical protein